MIQTGDTAPDFELTNQSGDLVSLSSLLNNGDDLSDLDVEVVGISPQSVDSHQRFASRHSSPLPILCDERSG